MTHCPSQETLEMLLSGRMAEPELSTAAAHVDGCATCQAALEKLAEDGALSELRPRGPVRFDGGAESAPGLVRVLADIRSGSTPQFVATETADGRSGNQPASLGPARRDGDIGSLDSYFVRREIGRGGMGVVFEAFDPELARPVAIKMLRPDRTDAASRVRFVREAQAAARLKHEHIVTVYSVVNPQDAPPYFVMEFVSGQTLRERIDREQRLDPREAAELCIQVANGLAAAHAAGLVHRDVKPSNVLLEKAEGGERRAESQNRSEHDSRLALRSPLSAFRPKLTDFGLARLTSLPPGSTLTREGMVAGTPAYMSPE